MPATMPAPQPAPDARDLLTKRQAIAELGISASTFDRLRAKGHLKAVAFGSKCLRYRRRDLEKLLNELTEG